MNDRLPHERGFHISWDQMHRDARALAWRLDGREWRAILAITRGGLVPAMIVARELDVRTIDTISVKSYKAVGAEAKQGEIQVLKAPDHELMADGEGILVIDDLVDSGRTLEHVRKLYPKAHFATVYAKPKGRPMVQTYVTEVSQDTWIFFPWDMALQYVQPYRGED
ncbi:MULTISPECIES: xanthine phosphoribosyltransferase [Paracoccus]|jgi:xanthine phosphoribosyltransferase|uniref:Xanthine-guanine phosphoribosyltransferase n=1 Tax=Paracoccus litorisediminis TaxID=2006130 RepID=A0A844HIU4_9RHOB|nr:MULTISPECIES: xanthine phosphoribosyltransferase [Paracoccus]MBD9525826.1 xanthine phosphoribosyltransferase [Paracoccus sp. PAR01]MTH58277.1 xanthine phosphoribosyltransferase [Paracoccus litorisediminis]